jgi:hypothetical protein
MVLTIFLYTGGNILQGALRSGVFAGFGLGMSSLLTNTFNVSSDILREIIIAGATAGIQTAIDNGTWFELGTQYISKSMKKYQFVEFLLTKVNKLIPPELYGFSHTVEYLSPLNLTVFKNRI